MRLPRLPRKFDLEAARQEIGERGFTVKLGWIDNQPGGKLNGIRFMDCRELMDRALSIQIFDRQTATISWGLDNKDSVTLTKEDGRQFIEWLVNAEDTPLTVELFELLPEATEAEPARAGATNMAKARLVEYLVAKHPDKFGKYGSMGNQESPAGEAFYAELLDLVENPERDGRDLARLVQSLDSLAANLYAVANSQMKTGAPAMRWRAVGSVLAAEEIRDLAQEARRNMGIAPRPATDYPGAITSAELYAQILQERTNPKDQEPKPTPPWLFTGHRPGDTVVIEATAGRSPARANQIGTVESVSDHLETSTIQVRFKDGHIIDYDASNVRRLL